MARSNTKMPREATAGWTGVQSCRAFHRIGLALLLFAAAGNSQSGLSFRGSLYTDLGMYHAYHREARDEFDFRGITTLGLNFHNVNQRHGKIEGSVDVLMPHGLYLRSVANAAGGVTSDSGTLLMLFDKAPLIADVRKLYLSVFLPFADVTLGRQIINFGKGYLFSPIDVFSRVEVTDLNFRRSGSDIAMVRVPVGALSGIDLVVELPFLDRTHSSALKLFTTLGGWDASLVGIYRHAGSERDGRDETVLGAAFKGDLEVGIHGEAVVSLDDALGNPRFEGMLGADYSVGDRITLMAEYLYKQPDPAGSPWGEHNVFGSARFSLNDLMNVSGSIIHDFEHSRTIGTIQFFYNILQNVNVTTYLRGYSGMPLYDAEYAVRVEVKF